MNLKTAHTKFSSLDRSTVESGVLAEPDRYRQLLTLNDKSSYIAQGAGLSYAPLSFGSNSTVINLSSFDRILSFNPQAGLIEVEGGISLGKLYDFLAPRGFFLPVQPGHPQISIGGCIACDVHGKNQAKEGNFRKHVKEITLFHPSFGIKVVAKDELFELTCGGFGLTGIILSATLAIKPMSSNSVTVSYLPAKSLQHSIELLLQQEQTADVLYTFTDLSPLAGYKGKGFVVSGKITNNGETRSEDSSYAELKPGAKTFGFPVFNPFTSSLLNSAYRLYFQTVIKQRTISFFEFSFPIASVSFYYSLYGPTGFLETQLLIPSDNVNSYVQQFQSLLRREKPRIYLSSLKVFAGEQRLLNFDGKGISFALDLPNTNQSREFLAQLDKLNNDNGVITNIAKDSRLSRDTVSRQYSEFERFASALHKYDSKRLFRSALSERLGI